jgi:hypothetical protein
MFFKPPNPVQNPLNPLICPDSFATHHKNYLNMLLKTFALSSICIAVMLQSCQNTESSSAPAGEETNEVVEPDQQFTTLTADPLYSLPISIDTANRMIQSYLTSVNAPATNTFMRSMLINADTLRNYINDTSHGKIASIKLFLSHQLTWINSGHYGVRAGTKSNAFALVLVGLDASGHYIYNRNNMVYEHLQPCPYHCPENNTDLLTQ